MLDPSTVSFHSANGKHLASRCPDSKVHGANMGPIWGRQDPGGPHYARGWHWPLPTTALHICNAPIDLVTMIKIEIE